jgi:hypothetical protein
MQVIKLVQTMTIAAMLLLLAACNGATTSGDDGSEPFPDYYGHNRGD